MRKLTRKEKVKKSQQRKKLEQAKLDKKFGLGFLIVGMTFILFFGNMWLNRNKEITKEEIISIDGTTDSKLEIKSKKTAGKSITIQLKEYPKIKYVIGRFSTSRINANSLLNNIQVGDKIQIDILKKVLNKIELNKQRTISVYGLRNSHSEYLNVNDYNSARKKDRNSIAAYLLLGFSFWMFGYGIYLIVESNKKIQQLIISI